MMELLETVFVRNNLVVAFAVVGLTIWLSYLLADRLTAGRIHGSASAIAVGLVAAWAGGVATGGNRGVADFALLSGIGLMGGGMMRDFAIVATAFGAQLSELKKAGLAGVVSIFAGVIVSFVVGAAIAVMFGYTDPTEITTIGAGAVTYIVGPVTGEAIGASQEMITLSVAAGLVKSILVMIGTPLVARYIGAEQSTVGDGIRRPHGNHERRRRRPGGYRPEAGAIRRHDSHFLYRRRLPAGAFDPVFYC